MVLLQPSKLITRVRFPLPAPNLHADMAQVVERILGKDEVGSSNLPISTSSKQTFPFDIYFTTGNFWLRGHYLKPPISVPRGTTHV